MSGILQCSHCYLFKVQNGFLLSKFRVAFSALVFIERKTIGAALLQMWLFSINGNRYLGVKLKKPQYPCQEMEINSRECILCTKIETLKFLGFCNIYTPEMRTVMHQISRNHLKWNSWEISSLYKEATACNLPSVLQISIKIVLMLLILRSGIQNTFSPLLFYGILHLLLNFNIRSKTS